MVTGHLRQDHHRRAAVASWPRNLFMELEVARGVVTLVARRRGEARRVAACRLVARCRVARVVAGRCIAVAASRRRHVIGYGYVLRYRRVAAGCDRCVASLRCTVGGRLAIADRIAAITRAIRAIAWAVAGAITWAIARAVAAARTGAMARARAVATSTGLSCGGKAQNG
jgi:hypothetical protein